MQQKLERKAPKLARFLKEFEIQFKWLFVWIFLRILSYASRRHAKPLNPRAIKSVLFLRHDKIGDMVVTLPTLRTLRYFRPDITIGVLASPTNHRIIENDPAVDHIHVYHKSIRKVGGMFREIQAVNYDMIVDLMTGTSVTSLVIAMLCSPRAYRAGICKESFGKYYDNYTMDVMNVARKLHITEMFLATMDPLGIKLHHRVPESKIALSKQQQQRGKELELQIRDPKAAGLIMLNVSAGKLDRTISHAKFCILVEDLSRRYPQIEFLISYAPNEIAAAREARSRGGQNVTLLPEGVGIMDLVALIPNLDAIISVDTSVCHIAANLDVPLLALYTGNEPNFVRWRPYGKKAWAVRSPNWKSVDGITSEQLQKAADEFIAELSRRAILTRAI